MIRWQMFMLKTWYFAYLRIFVHRNPVATHNLLTYLHSFTIKYYNIILNQVPLIIYKYSITLIYFILHLFTYCFIITYLILFFIYSNIYLNDKFQVHVAHRCYKSILSCNKIYPTSYKYYGYLGVGEDT